MSTSFVDSDGTTRFRGDLEGSGAPNVRLVVVPVAFTDIDPVTGFANAYLLQEGETLLNAWPIVTTTFDGKDSGGVFGFTGAQLFGPGGAAGNAQASDTFDCTASSVGNAVDGLMGADPTDGGGATTTLAMMPLVSPVIGGGPVQLVIDFVAGNTPATQGTQGLLALHLTIAEAPSV